MVLIDFKPISVVAVQWTGENEEEIKNFCSSGYITDKNQYLFYTYDKQGNEEIIDINDWVVNINGRLVGFTQEEFYRLFTDHYKDDDEMQFMDLTPTASRRLHYNNDGQTQVEREFTLAVGGTGIITNTISEQEILKNIYINCGEFLKDNGFLQIDKKPNENGQQIIVTMHAAPVEDWKPRGLSEEEQRTYTEMMEMLKKEYGK